MVSNRVSSIGLRLNASFKAVLNRCPKPTDSVFACFDAPRGPLGIRMRRLKALRVLLDMVPGIAFACIPEAGDAMVSDERGEDVPSFERLSAGVGGDSVLL